MATKLKSYSTTPASNNSAPPDGWPEGMLPSAVNNSAREVMARLAEWYADAEWILRNDTVTGFTGTTLTITGDVTAKYTVNRAIRLDESNSKRGIITASSYGAPSTTVTVSGYTIVGTPTAVELGIIDASSTGVVTIAGAQTVQGAKTFSGITTFQKQASIARVALTDAATIAVDASLSNVFTVTLAGNRTLGQPTNPADGQGLTIFITQDGTGSRTLAYHADWLFPGGTDPTLSTAAASVDVLSAVYNGATTKWYATLSKAFA